jgi:hypothetical protein
MKPQEKKGEELSLPGKARRQPDPPSPGQNFDRCDLPVPSAPCALRWASAGSWKLRLDSSLKQSR